jgi:ferredoxin--NADP+ reductase
MSRAFIGENDVDAVVRYPAVTREPFRNRGATTDDFAESERPFADIDPPLLTIGADRAALCGRPIKLNDLRQKFLLHMSSLSASLPKEAAEHVSLF